MNQGRLLLGNFCKQLIEPVGKESFQSLSQCRHISPPFEVGAAVARLELPLAHCLQEVGLRSEWTAAGDGARRVGYGAILIERETPEASAAVGKAILLK